MSEEEEEGEELRNVPKWTIGSEVKMLRLRGGMWSNLTHRRPLIVAIY